MVLLLILSPGVVCRNLNSHRPSGCESRAGKKSQKNSGKGSHSSFRGVGWTVALENRSKPGSQFGNLRGICKQIPGSCSLPKNPAPNFSRSDFQDTRRWMGDTWWHLGSSGIPLFHPRPSNLTDFLPQFPSSLPKNHNGSSWWSFSPAGIVRNWEFRFFFLGVGRNSRAAPLQFPAGKSRHAKC